LAGVESYEAIVQRENIRENKNPVKPGHQRTVREKWTNGKSLLSGTVGPCWPRSANGGYRCRENWGSRARRFKSGQPDKKTLEAQGF
jgi:hypothetical protein